MTLLCDLEEPRRVTARALVCAALLLAAAGCDATPGSPPAPTPASDGGDALVDRPPDPAEETVRNVPAGCRDDAISAGRGEDGHWIAARITPPSAVFELRAFRYELFHGPRQRSAMCDSTVAHRAAIFVATDRPPATPVWIETFDIPAEPITTGDRRVIERRLARPVTLYAPSQVYVAVQYGGRAPVTNCVVTCDNMGNTQRTWWSGAVEAPFLWRTLASYSYATDFDAALIGVRR